MFKWDAIVLTCPNKNSSQIYQKEIKLRQEKGLINKETLVICIDDPGNLPSGSGGATLNALLVVAESLSSKNQYKVTQVEVLKETFILIMHLGRHYPFDICGKAWCTLPFQDEETNNLLTNFDLLFYTMSNQIAKNSYYGIYVCSTDMLFLLNENEKIAFRDHPIVVISSQANDQIVRKNGIYEIDEKNIVKNIYYQPDENLLNRLSKNNEYNMITGIVYFNYEVAKILYSLMLFSPIDACSYIGIDSGASSLSLSLFFDILLATCNGMTKDTYIQGMFKTNLDIPQNNLAIIKQARSVLWDSLHNFEIKNITLDDKQCKHIYMDNESLDHRKSIFNIYSSYLNINNHIKSVKNSENDILELNFFNSNSTIIQKKQDPNGNSFFINTVIDNSIISHDDNVFLLNCYFKSSNVHIGKNTVLNDVLLENTNISYPSDLFIQNIEISLECFKTNLNMNIIFGVNDNLMKKFNDSSWTIMNKKWFDFIKDNPINENDLWPQSEMIEKNEKTLINAKLYPIMHLNLNKTEMTQLSNNFWIDFKSKDNRSMLINKWKQCVRVSLEDIISMISLENLFKNRRNIFNIINANYFIDSILKSRPIKFISLIRNAVHDGYANELLNQLEKVALENYKNLMILPKIMVFISNTLCEMVLSPHTVRSGPSNNSNWNHAFQLIEQGQIENALIELQKERLNWMNRDDLLIRAARHYEGATLSFIRQATSSFSSSENNPIVLERVNFDKNKNFEFVEAIAPARLDLAGAWSDTPPITYECIGGSCVTNVAILVNGIKPIGAKGRITKNKPHSIKIIMQNSLDDNDLLNQVSFEFFNLEDFKDYNKPQAVACLMKAVCVFVKLVELNHDDNLNEQLKKKLDGSLELYTWTGLPQGSGLGTSSILAACVLKVVWFLMGINVSNETLSYGVLVVEQLMTTNGGWQDQVGAIYGGFKYTSAQNKLPLEMNINTLQLRDEFEELINSRLLLIYTGLTRLAKDLLINVIRNWYSISNIIYDNVHELIKNGIKCKDALENENLDEFGHCINMHRKQKLIMAPGSEPDSVITLINKLEPYVLGMALAGAGGGGFVYILLKENKEQLKTKINELIDSNNLNMQIYDAKISKSGIEFRFK